MEDLDENKTARVNVKKKRKPQNKRTFVVGVLRRASFKWHARTEAMQNARVARGQYRCAICGEIFKAKEVDLDHVEPVVDPKTGWTNYDDFIERLFCEADKFQVICNGPGSCHETKTYTEDVMRVHYKKKRDKLSQDKE